MKTSQAGGFAVFGALVLAMASMAAPLHADANGTPAGAQMLGFVGQPQVLFNATIPYMWVTFANQSPSQVNGSVYVALHNGLGETVAIASSPIVAGAGQSASTAVFLNVPFDSYTADVFVVDGSGVAISPTVNGTIVA
jgi:hypothetical protein